MLYLGFDLQVPTMTEWLRSTLNGGARVGADPRLLAADSWKTFAEDLASEYKISLELGKR